MLRLSALLLNSIRCQAMFNTHARIRSAGRGDPGGSQERRRKVAAHAAGGRIPHSPSARSRPRQGRTKLRFSSAFTEQDLRAGGPIRNFATRHQDGYGVQPFWGNTLFKRGTELVALQRGNLEMCNPRLRHIQKQIPAWSSRPPYLFRDADHLRRRSRATSAAGSSDGARTSSASRSSRPVYFRRAPRPQTDKTIKTPPTSPASSCACRPASSGSSWAVDRRNPTPVAYAEGTMALQSWARSTVRTIRWSRASS